MNIDSIMERNKRKLPRGRLLIAVGFAALISLIYWYIGPSDASVESRHIQQVRVEQGSIPQTVDAYGKLRSKTTRMLTAHSQAIVEEISRFPGEQVGPKSVIMRLSNPELELQYTEVQAELASKRFEFEEFQLASALSEMEIKGEVERIQLEIVNQTTLRDAQEHLVKLGIIPQYEYLMAEAELEKSKMLLRFLQDKQEQLKLINEQRISIRLTQIEQQERRVALHQDRVSRAVLRAGMQGIVEELHIEVGQSVNPGDKLAMVSSSEDLVAEIMVLQREASLIRIGDSVNLDTFGSKGSGNVTRVDPVVKDGRVLVEVELTGELPRNARPELTVSASIEVAVIEDVLFVNNHRFFIPETSQNIFVLEQGGANAKVNTVHFGEQYKDVIVVEDGLRRDDIIVIFNDGKNEKELETIRIVYE